MNFQWASQLGALLVSLLLCMPASQAQTSRLDKVLASRKIHVCIWPDYYGISLSNPRSGKLEGIDSDMALELGKDLAVSVEFVDSSFSKLIPDVTGGRCDIAMFGVAVTPARAKKLRFTQPTMATDIYAITSVGNRRIRTWADIDKAGTVVAVIKGTLHEPVMRERLKAASLLVLDTPMAREEEVLAGRADVFMTDFPYSRRMLETTDWARLVAPPSPYHISNLAYALAPGDDKWFNRIEKFVQDIKSDGRLANAAARHRLEPVVLKN